MLIKLKTVIRECGMGSTAKVREIAGWFPHHHSAGLAFGAV